MAETKFDPPPEDDAARDRRVYLEMIDELHASTARTVAGLKADNARVVAENWRLIQEKAEREAPQWLTLKRAAAKAGCHEEWARAWAARAVAAGRSNEATKTAGIGVRVNVTALIAALRH
jgi:hypothetical protein